MDMMYRKTWNLCRAGAVTGGIWIILGLGALGVLAGGTLYLQKRQGAPMIPRLPVVPPQPVVNTSEFPRTGQDWLVESLDITLKWIAPGEFVMGSPESEAKRRDDESLHNVRIPEGFWMSQFELRHRDFQAFTEDSGYLSESERGVDGYGTYVFNAEESKILPAAGVHWRNLHANGPDHPVLAVSWNDVVAFCEWLTAKERANGSLQENQHFTLPTETQWEYACRNAGSVTTPFHFGESLSSHQANMNGYFPYGDAPRGTFLHTSEPVGQYPPNALGLYDMHGNVFEWCLNQYEHYDGSQSDHPTEVEMGDRRCYRGGSWFDLGEYCRAAFRGKTPPSDRSDHLGARIVLIQK